MQKTQRKQNHDSGKVNCKKKCCPLTNISVYMGNTKGSVEKQFLSSYVTKRNKN